MIQILAAGAMLLAQTNAATPCITRAEVSVMAVALLPDLVTRAGERCASHIGADDFLTRQGGTLAARLRQEGAGQRGAARTAFEKIAGQRLPAGVSDDVAVSMMAQAMSTEFTGNLDADGCRNVNALFESMAPLPASNMGNLVSSLLALTAAGRPSRRGPPLCRA